MRTLKLVAIAAVLAASLSACAGVTDIMSTATLSDADLASKTAGALQVASTDVTILGRTPKMMELSWTASVAGRTYECSTYYNMGATYGDTCRPVTG